MTLALLIFLMLLTHKKPHPTGDNIHIPPSATNADAAAAAAAAAAAQLARRAAQTNHPADHAAASTAADAAKILSDHAQAQKTQAASTPAPWPQVIPAGLPPWPSGWQPDNPPPAEVVSRAWQLLPILWKHGSGTRKTEQTGGRWITYVATYMNASRTMKGVTAFRPSSGGSSTPPRQPSGNA